MSEKVVLDPEIINKLRLQYTDCELREMFKTSTKSINDQCWDRKKLGIPFIQRNRRKNYEIDEAVNEKKWFTLKKSKKPYIEERKLEQRSWNDVYPTKKEKNWEWEIVRVGESMHPYILTRIK